MSPGGNAAWKSVPLWGAVLLCATGVVVAQTTAPSNPPTAIPPGTSFPSTANGLPATGPAGSHRLATTLPAAVMERAERLIRQLGDDDWKKRKAAEKQLGDMGPLIAWRLQQVVDQTSDEEVRGRAQGALATIAERRLLGASPIYLDAHGAEMKDVVAEVLAQANAPAAFSVEAIVGSEKWRPVTIHSEGDSYWKVLQEIEAQSGLHLTDWKPMSEQTVWGGFAGALATTDGPFILMASNIGENRSLPLQAPDGKDDPAPRQGASAAMTQTYVTCMVMGEPKMQLVGSPQFGSPRMEVVEAVDDLGNNLIVPNALVGISLMGGDRWPATLQLKTPPAGARTIRKLVTKFSGSAATTSEELVMEDALHAKPLTRTIDGKELVIQPLRKISPQIYELVIQASGPGANPAMVPQDLMALVQEPRITLRDAGGQASFTCQLSQTTAQGVSAQARYQFLWQQMGFRPGRQPMAFKPMQEPLRLTLRVPTATKPVEATFTFVDLPLP